MTAHLTCDRIRPLLSAYHDDALSHAERARVREHVATCAGCRSTLEMYDRVYAAVRAVPAPAVPFELRHNVYSQIAAIEAGRRWGAPFGPAVGRTVRATGSTAGVLAVLGALVLAALRLGSDANHSPAPAIMAAAPFNVAGTAVSVLWTRRARGSTLPPVEQTAVVPMRAAAVLAGVGAMVITGLEKQSRGNRPTTMVRGIVIQGQSSGSPRGSIPFTAEVSLVDRTPVVQGFVRGTPSPVPTISSDEGLVYLGFDRPDVLRQVNTDNALADVEYHPAVLAGRSVVLATPVADSDPQGQLFTGLMSNPTDGSIYFSARGRENGGIFRLDPMTLHATRVVSLADYSLVDHAAGYGFRFVQQLYHQTGSSRLAFALIDEQYDTVRVSIEDVDPNASSPQSTVHTLRPASDPWFDYVLSPDQRRMAWVDKPAKPSGYGMLKVSSFGAATSPTTITIGPGAHPEWSPDSQDVLYRDARQTALYLWGPSAVAPRQVVAVDPASLRNGAYISSFAWAPGNHYIAYVVSATDGPGATSRVYLADVTTGYSWPVFQHAWIGAIAWAREPRALRTIVTTPPATPTVTPTTVSLANGTGTTGTTSTIGAGSVVPTPVTAAVSPRVAADNGDTSPTATLLNYYRALNRKAFVRAFGLIAAADQRNFAHFQSGFKDTAYDTIEVLDPAPYLNVSNDHATACVAFQIEARHNNGKTVEYGGWYALQSTTGQSPSFGGWRIALSRSHIHQGLPATRPTQARCG